jgi:hypothetical protein
MLREGRRYVMVYRRPIPVVIKSDEPSRRGGLVAILVIVGVVVALIVWGIVGGFKSLTNLIRYGQFTTNATVAVVDAHLNDPNYFSRLASQARISIVSWGNFTIDGSGPLSGATAMFTFKNSSSNAHDVWISYAKELITNNGRNQIVELTCNIGVGNSFTIPAGGTVQIGQCYNVNPGDNLTGQARLIEEPHIIAIDNLPVHGGPQNTPWKCLIPSSVTSDVIFSNSC